MGEPAGGTRPMGEPALWGNPPYGGTRPQRGLSWGYREAIVGLLWGNPHPTRAIVGLSRGL